MALLVSAATAGAQSADSTGVLGRTERHASRMTEICGGVYGNPAQRRFMRGYSYTEASFGHTATRTNRAVSSCEGTGTSLTHFSVDSYARTGEATLWGGGSYTTGRRRATVWNEVADAELVYPYIAADAAGGDMKSETYGFAGGYASGRGRTSWGAELGYTAGQHYRDVDPRPRDITGRLKARAGMAYRVGRRYLAGLSGDFMKYKQTSDIDFMSELGQATVYHLTGLGTDYVRFRGNGFTTRYDGSQYGVAVSATPCDGEGMYATLHLQRLAIETVLNDMNKLPLSDILHNSAEAEMGYRHGGKTRWGADVRCRMYRRRGRENIFGDAEAATYPMIGTVEMYADEGQAVAARGLVEHRMGGATLSYVAEAGYRHRRQTYALPRRVWMTAHRSTAHSVRVYGAMGRRWHATLDIGAEISLPVAARTDMDDGSGEAALMAAVRSDFVHAAGAHRSFTAAADIRYALNRNNALRLSAVYRHDRYAARTRGNALGASVGVVF